MKTTIFYLSAFVLCSQMILGQRAMIDLSFSAENNGVHLQLDSIKITNLTQGLDTILYWPDTVLFINYVGISENRNRNEGFHLIQNYPNPVSEQTTISFFVPEKDRVRTIVTDLLGRSLLNEEWILDQGKHSCRFIPGNGNIYLFTAQWRNSIVSIKILHSGSGPTGYCKLEYAGTDDSDTQLKTVRDLQEFIYLPMDELRYVGYVDGIGSGILDMPEGSRSYIFQYATNIPCPEAPTVTYEGRVYNTIQVLSQCWLKENLSVGELIPAMSLPSNNGVIEKYCYGDDPYQCDVSGGLYLWDEMMQYASQQGGQGICPPGWHVPVDEEWKILEGVADSQHGIGDPVWDAEEYRGYDAGKNLKATSGWYGNNNGVDLYGFAALPTCMRVNTGTFNYCEYGYCWSSTVNDPNNAWYRGFVNNKTSRKATAKVNGLAVRCIKDI